MIQPDLVNSPSISLSSAQESVINAPIRGSLLLTGQAGSGKTTCGAHRLRYMVENGTPGESILVMVPQRSLAAPYYTQIHASDFPPGGQPSILTFNGLTQRSISLFWPLIAHSAGFKHPNSTFRFLTIETAQYYLAAIVEPLLQKGNFESLTIDPNRLYSQILDNLNKSAIVGFPINEIASRLSAAWVGKPSQLYIYRQAEECATLFREFCLANNFLDFSLQLSVFKNQLWPTMLFREHLQRNYQHLIYDNAEEDYPVAHDFVGEMLPNLQSALLIMDTDGGFRSFLGADPVSAGSLAQSCTGMYTMSESFVTTKPVQLLNDTLRESIISRRLKQPLTDEIKSGFSIHSFRFYPEAIDWIVTEIQDLRNQLGVAANEIAILTPYLSDALRFSLATRLEVAGLPFITYRPSRSLREEPAVRTLLTFARIAHPSWEMPPRLQDVRAAFNFAIQDCDFSRADLLAKTLFRLVDAKWTLNPFDRLNLEMQDRITFTIGKLYSILQQWLTENRESGSSELDHWLNRFYGECLSQPGFGFHSDFDAAASVSHLIDSCRKFRNIYISSDKSVTPYSGQEFIRVLEGGILAAQSIESQTSQSKSDAVFLGPAFSFLMRNKPVAYQFWIDIGSQGWWSRLEQPLTQPHVLNRNWDPSRQWTDVEEYENNQLTLSRLTTGLLRRCRSHIYMSNVAYNERGIEERGQLLLALQSIQRSLSRQNEVDNVHSS